VNLGELAERIPRYLLHDPVHDPVHGLLHDPVHDPVHDVCGSRR
jgi:hypothetical protein